MSAVSLDWSNIWLMFLPHLAEVEEPLRRLIKKDTVFHWDKPQEYAFHRIKELLCSIAPILAYYDVKKNITIQYDASKNAVGAVLLQGQPIYLTHLESFERQS